jgi:hypothetical protein
MKAPDVPRVAASELSVERFLTEYVLLNRPVVVTGDLELWDLANRWMPAALERQFGDQLAQVYNNYFDLQSLMPLKRYLAQNFNKPTLEESASLPYVRWYTKMRDIKFFWADEIFAKLRSQWFVPTFLPKTGYLLPYTAPGAEANPVINHFPAKGLFISPRGARTSLHVDPWGSCAILCQLYGSKRWYLYAPDQSEYLRNDFGVVDVTRPDLKKFPAFARAQLNSTCTLKPGEIIYVPHGWYHQVQCESDAISLTWNFVHRATAASFIDCLKGGTLSKFDESVLRFFYGIPPGRDVVGHVLTTIGGC